MLSLLGKLLTMAWLHIYAFFMALLRLASFLNCFFLFNIPHVGGIPYTWRVSHLSTSNFCIIILVFSNFLYACSLT